MAKVTIKGEVFPFDLTLKPLTEILTIEQELDCTYAEWEAAKAKGSARAFAGLVWAVLHRNGRTDVTISDILSGNYPLDLATDVDIDQESDADPTSPPPDPSGSTAAATSVSSPRSSASGRGKSST